MKGSLFLYFFIGFTLGFLIILLFGLNFISVIFAALLGIVFEIFLYIRGIPPKRKKDVEDLVCIIIPAYNEENSLRKSVESATKQSYKNKLIVLVNDNSTDNTGILMERYAKEYENVIYLRNYENLGKFSSIMRVFKEVSADTYVIVDADNEFPENYIEYYMKRMENIDALETPLSSYNACKNFTSLIHTLEISLMSSIRFMNLFPNFTGRGMFIRKKVLEFLHERNIKGKDDGAMMNIAMKHGNFKYRYFTGPALKEYATEKFRDFVNQRDRWYTLGMVETLEKGTRILSIVFGLYSSLVFSTIFLGVIMPLLGFRWYLVLMTELLIGVFVHSIIYSRKFEIGCNRFINGIFGIVMLLINTSLIFRSFCRVIFGKIPKSWYKVPKS